MTEDVETQKALAQIERADALLENLQHAERMGGGSALATLSVALCVLTHHTNLTRGLLVLAFADSLQLLDWHAGYITEQLQTAPGGEA